MEQELKKYSIGYNTISSVDGVINARGVKSKPNNIEIYGYTHEIGTGTKSPDNPYQLVSLDSGNVNLYSEDKLVSQVINTTGDIRMGIKLSTPKSGCYCVRWDENTGTKTISYRFVVKSTNVIEKYNYIKENSIISVPDGYDVIFYDSSGTGINKYAFTERTNLMILDSPIMPSEYITDEHSIILSNNDMSIQVPVPIALTKFRNVSDCIFKNSEGTWKVTQNNKKIFLLELKIYY